MILGKLFGVASNSWEEGLVAAAYLYDLKLELKYFESTTVPRIDKLMRNLGALPMLWARELSLEVLHGSSNADPQ